MAGERPIGDRWEHFLSVCSDAEDHADELGERTMEFVSDIGNKLSYYGTSCFITTPQINWLNRIEQEINDIKSGKPRTRSRR